MSASAELKQQEEAQQGLTGLYGMDVRGQTENAAQQAPDINAEVNANKTGWLQNVMNSGVDISEMYKNVMQGMNAGSKG